MCGNVSQTLGTSPRCTATFPKLWELPPDVRQRFPNFGNFPPMCGNVSQTLGGFPRHTATFPNVSNHDFYRIKKMNKMNTTINKEKNPGNLENLTKIKVQDKIQTKNNF
jgi:hypothetical protein